MSDKELLEAVIIGSGFGGAVTACRLSKKWPGGKVMVLERGKRYPRGCFARSPREMADNFWSIKDDRIKRPPMFKDKQTLGLFDIGSYNKMDVVRAAGLGGGSLIYANVFMEMPDHVFENGQWPSAINLKTMKQYYDVAREVMGARTIPDPREESRRVVRRSQMYKEVCEEMGRETVPADICVFFGNDHGKPLPMGEIEKNRYGAIQTSCVYCAECDLGCNYHSKNTLDLNYLHVAESKYKADIRTETLAWKIVPLNEGRNEDPEASGKNGYRVYFRELSKTFDGSDGNVDTRRVILSAGTLGTNELLLRCRDQWHTLPHLNSNIGKGFSGNGDFQYVTLRGRYVRKKDSRTDTDINHGPVITTMTDFNLFKDHEKNPGSNYIMEDAALPSHLSWLFEGLNPFRLARIPHIMKEMFWGLVKNRNIKRWGPIFQQFLRGDISSGLIAYLLIGLDAADGTISLDEDETLSIDWPQTSNELYNAFRETSRKFGKLLGSSITIPMFTWTKPYHKNITVHPLGGCALSDSKENGVVSGKKGDFGKVFEYENLFISDAAMIPSAIGSNPAATILALAEKVAEGITGKKPDANL